MAFIDPENKVIARSSFWADNPGVQRYPKNTREWHNFITEVNKWIAHEEGSFTPTFNGFSSDPSGLCNWVRFGPTVHMRLAWGGGSGTSDDTVLEITNLPEDLRPDTAQIYWIFGGRDNGSVSTEPVSVLFQNSGVVSFGLGADNPSGGGWTASGNKGINNANMTVSWSVWSRGMGSG